MCNTTAHHASSVSVPAHWHFISAWEIHGGQNQEQNINKRSLTCWQIKCERKWRRTNLWVVELWQRKMCIKGIFSHCQAKVGTNKQYYSKYKLMFLVSARFIFLNWILFFFYFFKKKVAKESDSLSLGRIFIKYQVALRYIWWEMYHGLNSQVCEGSKRRS